MFYYILYVFYVLNVVKKKFISMLVMFKRRSLGFRKNPFLSLSLSVV